MTVKQPMNDRRSAPPATAEQAARCALCGYRPDGPNEADTMLRTLGTAPVVVLVCSDQDACVTRFAG